MNDQMRRKLIVGLWLFILLMSSSVVQAADYTYGNYYNKDLTSTTTGTTRGPSITGKGDKIVFWSDRNLDDNKNPSNYPQVFLWTSPSTITQITSTYANNYSVSSRQPLVSTNFDGTYIALKIYKVVDYCLSCHIKSIWRYNVNNGTVTPVASTGRDNTEITALKINGDGKKIFSLSNYDFTTGGDTSYELYLWSEGPPATFTKITSTNSATPPDTSFSITYEGNLIAFSTKENTAGPFAGKNPDGNYEIYMCSSTGSSLTQITSTTGGTIGSKEPSITSGSDWTKIAFSSDRDLTGNNADGSTEIFLWTLAGTYSSSNTGSYTQVTSTPSGKECRKPQISKDGKFFSFYSNADITGGNPDGNYEVFAWNINGTTTQVTSTSGGSNNSYDPVIGSYTGLYESGDIQYGPRIAYYFNDGTKDNIFLATSTIAVPATSRWGLIILILLLATLAVFMLRRRGKTAKKA